MAVEEGAERLVAEDEEEEAVLPVEVEELAHSQMADIDMVGLPELMIPLMTNDTMK